jgi:D-alanyl-D-alanine carboxypeptidase
MSLGNCTPSEQAHYAVCVGGDIKTGGDPSAVVPWWSFSKTVIAAAALRLHDQGKLDAHQVIGQRGFTLNQLLQHTAGVRDYGKIPAYHRAVTSGRHPWSRRRLLKLVGADNLAFNPGSQWAYSNIGYLYVRDLIEDTTGLPLGAALHTLIFDPLELQGARLATTVDDFTDIYWPELRSYDPGWVYHGCLIGSPSDAAKTLMGILNYNILSEESLRSMLSGRLLGGAVPGRPWLSCEYGLGVMCGRMEDVGRAIGHTGHGPHTVNAVYSFADLPGRPIVAVFKQGEDDGEVEMRALIEAQAYRLGRNDHR